MKQNLKNVGESVRRRLLNHARSTDNNFNLVLTRYALERLLYRISQSEHRDRFVLKGAALYVIWMNEAKALPYRPTRDLDLWSSGSPSTEDILQTFRSILQTPVEDDGLEFLPETLVALAMRQDEQYEGCRLNLKCRLTSAQIAVQIDLGFGDAITPPAQTSLYPTLLSDSKAPELRTYPRETVVAEKFEAIVSLDLFNTRMKDFFDLWTLSHHFDFDGDILRQAITKTFERRQTKIPSQIPAAFTSAFTEDAAKNTAWKSFGKRSELVDLPELKTVAEYLESFLLPVSNAASLGQTWSYRWQPEESKWVGIK